MEDMLISCIQCGADFKFSVSDQIRHREMNFDDPKRCPDCRKRKSKPTRSRDKKFNHRKRSGQIMYEY
jgi:DNA-directed RNA polymerase subunit RPC12/RpoP